jgi:hypothetical protein
MKSPDVRIALGVASVVLAASRANQKARFAYDALVEALYHTRSGHHADTLPSAGEPIVTPEQIEEYRQEAERLKLLDRDTQKQVLAIYRQTAENRKIGKRDRQAAIERLAALERLLRIKPR